MSEAIIPAIVSIAATVGSAVDKSQRSNAEAKKRKKAETAMASAKQKKDAEDAAALEEERKRKARYGSANVPMTESLGAPQAGLRKTLLGG